MRSRVKPPGEEAEGRLEPLGIVPSFETLLVAAPQDEIEPCGKPAGTIGILRCSSRPGIGSRLALWHFATALDSEGYFI